MTTRTKKPTISKVPALMRKWDVNRNEEEGSFPEEITAGSKTKLWWKCSKGLDHSFIASAPEILRGYGCAVCRGFQILKGFNDFESNYPYQSRKWNYLFNRVGPGEVVRSSHKYFWFVCDEGHHFKARLNDIHNRGVWCSYCSGNRIWPGDGKDLAHTHPEISSQLHPDETTDIHMIGKGSIKPITWMCSLNSEHSWKASPNSRTNMGSGCPICVPKKSKAEVEIFNWISTELIPDYEVVANDAKALRCRKHIDIYIPSLRLGFEYNGNYWHNDRGDINGATMWKESRARSLGIELITIWEDDWRADPDYCKEVIRISVQAALYNCGQSQLSVD